MELSPVDCILTRAFHQLPERSASESLMRVFEQATIQRHVGDVIDIVPLESRAGLKRAHANRAEVVDRIKALFGVSDDIPFLMMQVPRLSYEIVLVAVFRDCSERCRVDWLVVLDELNDDTHADAVNAVRTCVIQGRESHAADVEAGIAS